MWKTKVKPQGKDKYGIIAEYTAQDNSVFTFGPVEVHVDKVDDFVNRAITAMILWENGRGNVDISKSVEAKLNNLTQGR